MFCHYFFSQSVKTETNSGMLYFVQFSLKKFILTFFRTLFYALVDYTMCLGVVQTLPSMHNSLHKLVFSILDARLVCYGELGRILQHGSMPHINYFDRKRYWKQQFME